MADTVDKYNADQEFLLKIASKPNLNKEVESTGFCLYCGEPLKDKTQRWCSKECRDDWEYERNRRRK